MYIAYFDQSKRHTNLAIYDCRIADYLRGMSDDNITEWKDYWDLPQEMQWMMQLDSLYSEKERWASERNKQRTIQKEIDTKLAEIDPDRIDRVVTVQEQILTMLQAAHDGPADAEQRDFIQSELPIKRQEYVRLMEEGENPEWKKRFRTHELIVHYTEEEKRCEEEIHQLEVKLEPFRKKTRKKNINYVVNYDDIDDDWAVDHRTPEQVEIDHLEFQMDMMKEGAIWENMSHEREVRKKQEKIQQMETQGLWDYLDQLDGLGHEVNEEWKKVTSDLEAEGDLTGRTFEVYFNNKHPGQYLSLRYKESLQGAPKWNVYCHGRKSGNQYWISPTHAKDKRYLVALGKDNKGHIFAFTFLSPHSFEWRTLEEKLGPAKSEIGKMPALKLFQFNDKITKAMIENRKKKASG